MNAHYDAVGARVKMGGSQTPPPVLNVAYSAPQRVFFREESRITGLMNKIDGQTAKFISPGRLTDEYRRGTIIATEAATEFQQRAGHRPYL
jgi:hypothetical protein